MMTSILPDTFNNHIHLNKFDFYIIFFILIIIILKNSEAIHYGHHIIAVLLRTPILLLEAIRDCF